MQKSKPKYNKVLKPLYLFEATNIWIENAQLETDARLAATLNIEEHEENGMMIEW